MFHTHLCKKQQQKGQRHELNTDWKTVEQPIKENWQPVCQQTIIEIEGEEGCTKSSPYQAEKEENSLVTQTLVAVPPYHP